VTCLSNKTLESLIVHSTCDMSLEDTPSPTSTTTPPLSTHGGADVGTVPVDGNKSTETFVGFDLEKPPPSFS